MLLQTVKHLFHPQRSNNHRPKILHPSSLFSLALIVAGCWLAVFQVHFFSDKLGSVLGFSSSITADEVVQQTNQQRAQQGQSTLKANSQLNQAALAKAQNMFSQQYWAHIAPDGTQPWKFFSDANYKYSVAGENLARDFTNTPDMMSAWMASPTHRKNILDNRYQEIGVAVVDGTLLGTQTTLVVQLFGTPAGAVPAIDQSAQKITIAQQPAVAVQTSAAVKSASSEQVTANQPAASSQPIAPMTREEVLASTILPVTSLSSSIFLSPLQISKIFFLAVILMIAMTLVYDSFIMNNYSSVRLVGKNLAHLALLFVTAFLLILFKGGVIG